MGQDEFSENMKLENMEMKKLHGPGLPVHSHSGGGLVQSASLRHSDPGFGFCDYCVDIAESDSAPTEYCPSLHFPPVRASVKGVAPYISPMHYAAIPM